MLAISVWNRQKVVPPDLFLQEIWHIENVKKVSALSLQISAPYDPTPSSRNALYKTIQETSSKRRILSKSVFRGQRENVKTADNQSKSFAQLKKNSYLCSRKPHEANANT